MFSPCFLGIDIGSSFSKAVVIREEKPVACSVLPSGGNYSAASDAVVADVCKKAGITLSEIDRVCATGYGGTSVPIPNRNYTDITCISRGVHHLFPSARTVVDIGGQYSRVISLDETGRNTGFLLSDKCAGGSGRFLQTVAHVLGIDLDDIGSLSMTSENPVSFTTGCAVFAETEAISRVAEGANVEDILAGVNNALAARIQTLVERKGLEPDIVLTGGGAKDAGLVQSIGRLLGTGVLVPDEPQIIAALGAALLASE